MNSLINWLTDKSLGIGFGSVLLGWIQRMIFLGMATQIAELMKIMATITTIGGALIVLLTLLIKGKQAWQLYFGKKDKTTKSLDE